MKTYPFHQSLSAPSPEPIVGQNNCELLGIFGWLV